MPSYDSALCDILFSCQRCGNENDRYTLEIFIIPQMAGDFRSFHIGHDYIQKNHIGPEGLCGGYALRTAILRFYFILSRLFKVQFYHLGKVRLVVYYKDLLLPLHRVAPFFYNLNSKNTIVPWPDFLFSTFMVPSCFPIIFLTIDSPSPAPPI